MSRAFGKWAVCVVLVLCLAQAFLAVVKAAAARTVVLNNVTLVDASARTPRLRQTVLIRGSTIQEVGANLRVPRGALIVDGAGKYVIPGLWDMHVHLSDARSSALPALVANGVTGVRDMGSHLAEIDAWRAEIGIGLRMGPTIIRAGPIVNGMAYGPMHLPVADAAEARGAVRALAAAGVDFIKIHAAVTRDEYFAIADETKRAGLPFVGHIAAGVTPAEASDAGQASIEHTETSFVGTPYVQMSTDQMLTAMASLFDKFAAHRTRYTPTLVMYQSGIDFRGFTSHAESAYVAKSAQRRTQQAAEEYKKLPDGVVAGRRQVFTTLTRLVGMMHAHGVPIMVGTDLSDGRIFPGFSVHEELALLVGAGLSPMDALRAATLTPAEFLKLSDVGVIAPGKRADLVVLAANPLADIHNTTRIEAVVQNGRLLSRTDLTRLLAESARRAQME